LDEFSSRGPERRGTSVVVPVASRRVGCNHPFVAGITLRNLDDDLFDWLRARAASRGTSLNSELLEILAVARGDEVAARARGPAAASARAARVLGVRTARSADHLRRDRDRRR
jgi:plasmid stability protein